jgi:hypothetical protein
VPTGPNAAGAYRSTGSIECAPWMKVQISLALIRPNL